MNLTFQFESVTLQVLSATRTDSQFGGVGGRSAAAVGGGGACDAVALIQDSKGGPTGNAMGRRSEGPEGRLGEALVLAYRCDSIS